MKKVIALFLTLCLLSTAIIPVTAFAEEAEPDAESVSETETDPQAPSEAEPESQPAPGAADTQDDLVTTSHTTVIHGKEIAYTVTTGTMTVNTGGETCEFSFRAYTMDGVADPGKRPITFAFNGGPGCCSYYLELGCLGPRRAEMDEQGHSVSLPAKLTDNENSLLDLTDLVFIDAIGTGYSRPTGSSQLASFIGYENDIRSFGDFIRLYINRNKRWDSEKYIAGESYGTTRAVGLCKYLADTYAVNVNGLMLFSTFNDFSTTVPSSGNDLPYVLNFPTYAADAWYHGMLDEQYQSMELEEFLNEVRDFVSKEYYPFLFAGNRLTEAEQNGMAGKMSSYIGLSREYIVENNYRITLDDFCSHLLLDKKLMVGRMDGRYTGPVTSGSLEDGESDPSSYEVDLILGNTFYAYLTNELNYETDRPYVPMSVEVGSAWTSPDLGTQWIGGFFSQEDIIRECMSKNPYLKVWVNCGYYDLATPFYTAEWIYARVFLSEDRKDNLTFTYYPAGHMFYTEKASFDSFRKEAELWFGGNKDQSAAP